MKVTVTVTMILVVILLSMNLFAQVVPTFSQVTQRVWARNTPPETSPIGNDVVSPMWQYVDNAGRLDKALMELRATNPNVFDTIFNKYGLGLDIRPAQ